MGFIPGESLLPDLRQGAASGYLSDRLRRICNDNGCAVCTLNKIGNRHPYMEATGSDEPEVYMLGEAPGKTEDMLNEQFIGQSGSILRWRVPSRWKHALRWNNSINCRPPNNRDPTENEIECCRSRIVRDIEATKPKAIFGFGNIPLKTIVGDTGINRWRGRMTPVQVGEHRCWYFPMFHPSFILHKRKFTPNSLNSYGCDEEFAFALDLRNAFEAVECGLPDPVIHTEEYLRSGMEIFYGGPGDLDAIVDFLRRSVNEPLMGLDFETKGVRPYNAENKILTAAMSTATRTLAWGVHHPEARWTDEEFVVLCDEMDRFLHTYTGRLVSHSLAFEAEWSAVNFGTDVLTCIKWGDTMSQAYLIREQQDGCLDLDFLYHCHFGLPIKSLSPALDKDNLDKAPLSSVLPYNGLDARGHRNLFIRQNKILNEQGMINVYHHHIDSLLATVATQIKGVPVDQSRVEGFFEKYSKELRDKETALKADPAIQAFNRRKGREFKPGSSHDVSFLCRVILRVPVENTEEETLEKIDHPAIKKLLEWRKVNKALSTYIIPLLPKDTPLLITQNRSCVFEDGLIHPILSTTKTRTWRTSSEDPNSQNYPKHGSARELRSQIVAPPGYVIVAFDYSGIQARNVAMESLDEKLVDSFWRTDGYDIHADWRDRIVRVYPAWVEEGVAALAVEGKVGDKTRKKYRQRAKNEFVFASFFGAHPPTLARHLGIPEECTVILREEFFHEFHDIDRWHKQLKADYYEYGYVTGLSGFRRHAPIKINELINAPIQADERRIVLGAMSRLRHYEDDRLVPNLEVHDDLTFIWQKCEVDMLSEIVLKEMTKIVLPWINTPIQVEQSIGPDWANLEENEEKFTSVKIWGHRRDQFANREIQAGIIR